MPELDEQGAEELRKLAKEHIKPIVAGERPVNAAELIEVSTHLGDITTKDAKGRRIYKKTDESLTEN